MMMMKQKRRKEKKRKKRRLSTALRCETVEPVQPITQPGTNTNLKYLKVTKREQQSGKKKWTVACEKARIASRDAGAKFDKEWSDMIAVQEGILQAGTEENDNGNQNGEQQEEDDEKVVN